MKRRAEHHLDRDSFLRGEEDTTPNDNQPATTGGNLATPDQIAQRRIVKLKLPSQLLAEQGAEGENRPTAKFEVAGGFGSNAQSTSAPQPEQTTSAAPSFLTKMYTPNQDNQNGSNQNEQKPQSTLFSALLHKSAEGELGLKVPEDKKETKTEEEKKPSLFGDLFAQKPADQSPAPLFNSGGSGLFSGQTNNLFSQNQTGGLFGSLFNSKTGGSLSNLADKDYSYVHKETGEKEEEKPAEKKQEPPAEIKPSLFANLGEYKPTSSLFASGDNAAKPSLFASYSTTTTPSFTSFLQTQQTSGGLFSSKPKGDDDGSEGGDGDDDDEPQRSPSPEADITKSKGNYQYEYDYDKVVSKKVTKFKPGVKNILLEGDVSLNKKKDSSSYFIIYRNKAKLVQYQGQIIPTLTKVDYLNPRQDALSVVLFTVETPQQTTEAKAEGAGETQLVKPKFAKDSVKIMFGTSDECNEFKKELDKVLV